MDELECANNVSEESVPEKEYNFKDSNVYKHAVLEFKSVGYKAIEDCTEEDGPNKWIQENVLELLEVFSNQGHSGSSAPFCVEYFRKLALFEPLGPLTGEDWEWRDSGCGSYQNIRCSHIFKDNDVAYDINGYVFWHWSEYDLEPGDEGYPGKRKYKSHFTSNMSRKKVTFPYTVVEPEYVEVDSFEVNKETNEREPGSGWWQTIYPDYIKEANLQLTSEIKGC